MNKLLLLLLLLLLLYLPNKTKYSKNENAIELYIEKPFK